MRPAEAMRGHPFTMAHGFDEDVAASSGSTSWALGELLVPVDIRVDARADRKREALRLVADLLARKTRTDPGAVLAALLRRERLGPTHVGDGIAMPHGRLAGSFRPAASVLRLHQPVAYGTNEDDGVDVLVAILWPEAGATGFVPTLARTWRLLRSPCVSKAIRRARTPEDLHCVLAGAEDRG